MLLFSIHRLRALIRPATAVILYALFPSVLFAASPDVVQQISKESMRGRLNADTIDQQLDGLTIRSVTIELRNVFEDPGSNLLFKTANQIKARTNDQVVRRELLFSEGDVFDSARIQESERQLRNLRYLRNITITSKRTGNEVDVTVSAQDTWTLIPKVGFSSGEGKNSRSAGLQEGNVFGFGKRLEVMYEQDENRNIVSTVWDDNRILGSDKRFVGALLQQSDGYDTTFFLGRPIRNLFDRHAWLSSVNRNDSIGRLFNNGTEDYIFRQRTADIGLRYTESYGDPRATLDRLTYGFDVDQAIFDAADAKDYQDLDLDPATVSNDPARLPDNRKFRGPHLGYEYVRPNYISMAYVDRFDRVEDYNLGSLANVSATFAPELLGSYGNNLLPNLTMSQGHQFDADSFLRSEFGIATRLNGGGFENSLTRFEGKYYNVLGSVNAGDLFLGRHTLAASLFIDYGEKLDADRQLLLGGDNALRGYPARAFEGDKRFAVNLEDRMYFVDYLFDLVSVGGAVFAEAGNATYNDFGSLMTDLYGDVGFGLRLAFPRSSGGQVLRLDVGFPLRRSDDGTSAFEIRLILAGGQLFSAGLRSESTGPENANVSVGVER